MIKEITSFDKCTFCGNILERVAISAPIPSKPDYSYIACSQCGKVMTAKVENINGEFLISEIEATPEDGSETTRAMIKESRELFNIAGINFKAVKISPSSNMEPLDESHCPDGCTCNTKEIDNTPVIKPNLLSIIISKIAAIFRIKR